MLTRQAYPILSYNGKDITEGINKYLESFDYTDPASGESDSISITLGNWDGVWLNGWFPEKGATLTAKIAAESWESSGADLSLTCGSFSLDNISFSGFPDVMTMGAISAPASDAFKGTERTKTWEDVTVKQMATDIANRYKLALVYDASTVKIAVIEQSNATDASFLETVCKDYGLSLKIYSNKLVIFDREKYKAKAAVRTIEKADMLSYNFNTTLIGTYTGGELVYTNADGDEITYKTGSGPRILKANFSANTAAEAKLKLDAAIKEANHGETTLSFSMIGQPALVSGQTIDIVGLGKADGKYYIDKLTHSLGDAYTTAFECAKVQ